MGHASKTYCIHNSDSVDSVSPHHSVTLELSIPLLDGDLHEIKVGVAFICGCDDNFGCGDDYKTYNWSLKNKTDNIIIDSGTVCPINERDLDICHSGAAEIAEDILLVFSMCQRRHWITHHWFWGDTLHISRLALSRLYIILREWRGKTLKFTLSCSDNSTKLSISSYIATSVYW